MTYQHPLTHWDLTTMAWHASSQRVWTMTIYQWISEAAYLERSELIIHSTVLTVMSCGMTGFLFPIATHSQ